jgi:hypothetical protein
MGPVRAPLGPARCEERQCARSATRATDVHGLASAIGNRRFTQLVCERKLARQPITVGAADDASEREADRVALGLARPTARRASPPAPAGAPRAPASVDATLASPGRPLDARARTDFEARAGVDLSAVRIHEGPLATASTKEVSALAYAVGTDVVLARAYRHDDPVARTVLAHELAHVVQHPDGRVLRRFTDCGRLLTGPNARPASGPRVSEDAVQEFLAEQLEVTGDVNREFPVPGASASPWRTDGSWDDTVIDPQVIGETVKGRVDIAYHEHSRELEFLEIKEADWKKAVFAEQQLTNYVVKANEDIRGTRKRWQDRGHPHAYFDYVTDMPTSRYTPSPRPTEIDGRQVMLAWCRPGVIVFKTLDVDNKDLHYCGISDKGRTDQFIDGMLTQGEDMVAKALARRLNGLSLGPVNFRLLLARVREHLRVDIRYLLQEAITAVCATALELSAAEVLAALRRRLAGQDLLDVLLSRLSPHGDPVPLPIAEAAAKTAGVLMLALILDMAMALVFAL